MIYVQHTLQVVQIQILTFQGKRGCGTAKRFDDLVGEAVGEICLIRDIRSYRQRAARRSLRALRQRCQLGAPA